MRPRLLLPTLFVAVFLAAAPARAQWAVFDGSNFVKNTVTAAQTAQSYTQMLTSYALQIQQYISMLRNLEQAPEMLLTTAIGREIIQQAGGDAAAIQDFINAGNVLLNVYQSSAQLMGNGGRLYSDIANFNMDMNRMSANSGMSWEQVFAHEMGQAGRRQSGWPVGDNYRGRLGLKPGRSGSEGYSGSFDVKLKGPGCPARR